MVEHRSGRRRGRAGQGAVGLLVVLAALLSGCASIPTSGPVVEGAEVDSSRDDQFIRVIARPPVDGMTAEQVVRGFLEASASFQDDYAVARSYLTPDAAVRWVPDAGVRVYDGASTRLTPVRAGASVFTAPLVGRIGVDGEATVADPGAVLRVPFGLAKVEGQWRLSSVPDGLLLSRGDVERGYRTFDVYYLDPTFSTLVPDPLTVRVSGPGLATTLVRALLRGATPWLAPAVRTAFPAGTSLAIDAVPVEGGVAQVALDTTVLSADPRTREALSAQLVWTLSALPDVTGVRITAGGQPLAVPGQGAVQSRDAWPQYGPDALPAGTTAYLLREGRVVRLVGEQTEPVPGAAGEAKAGLAGIAVSLDSAEVAGVSATGRTLSVARLADGAALALRAAGTGLRSPSYSRDGTLWWVQDDAGVMQRRPTGVPVQVRVQGIDAGLIEAVRLARDGTRAALLVREGSRRTLLLARVDATEGAPRLAAPRRVESRLSDVTDVAWTSAGQLVALGTDGAGAAQAFLVDIGHGLPARPIGAPSAPRGLAAAPGRLVLLGSATGAIWSYQSGRWIAGPEGSDPAYPG